MIILTLVLQEHILTMRGSFPRQVEDPFKDDLSDLDSEEETQVPRLGSGRLSLWIQIQEGVVLPGSTLREMKSDKGCEELRTIGSWTLLTL